MTMESIAYTEARKTEARLEDTKSKFMEMQMSHNQQQQQFQEETKQYQENNNAALINLANQLGQLVQLMANIQSMEVQTNTQTTPDKKNNILPKNEEYGECVTECVEKSEEESMSNGCGVEKIGEENQAPHEVELPQELPCTEGTNT
ncbi:hypothetical protein A2U01_0052267, partial [Trifolium medium]|nr:hypothetical protein [Trifolium medium]